MKMCKKDGLLRRLDTGSIGRSAQARDSRIRTPQVSIKASLHCIFSTKNVGIKKLRDKRV